MRVSILPFLIALTILIGAIFAIWPQIDLTVAAAFHAGGGFPAAHLRAWEITRKLSYWAPSAIMGGALALFLLRRSRFTPRGPSGKSIAFLLATLALGPGLLVNVALKDHSHRPRPVEVAQFGGPDAFRPWYRFDGDCAKNCSFVSGEAAAAFWTVAPALLTPPAARTLAVVAALAFGFGTSALRLAFGGHFLSDVAFAGLFTLLIVVGVGQWLRVWGSSRRPPEGGRARETSAETGALRERQPSL